MSFLLKKNNAYSSLSANINISALSLTVASASLFPTTGDFLATIWDNVNYSDPSSDPNMEVIKVTGVSGNTFTILRAQDNTSAHAHSSGNTIQMLITAKHFEELEEAIEDGVVGPTGPTGPRGPTGATGPSDHAELSNLDYENSGHTGFQKTLVYDSAFKAYEIE